MISHHHPILLTLDALKLGGLVACLECSRVLQARREHVDDFLVRCALALDGGDLPLGQRPHHVLLVEMCECFVLRNVGLPVGYRPYCVGSTHLHIMVFVQMDLVVDEPVEQ